MVRCCCCCPPADFSSLSQEAPQEAARESPRNTKKTQDAPWRARKRQKDHKSAPTGKGVSFVVISFGFLYIYIFIYIVPNIFLHFLHLLIPESVEILFEKHKIIEFLVENMNFEFFSLLFRSPLHPGPKEPQSPPPPLKSKNHNFFHADSENAFYN